MSDPNDVPDRQDSEHWNEVETDERDAEERDRITNVMLRVGLPGILSRVRALRDAINDSTDANWDIESPLESDIESLELVLREANEHKRGY